MSLDSKIALARKTRDFLLETLDKIKSRRDPYIAANRFRQLAFCVSALDWEPEGTIDFEPRFCDPFPADAFDVLFAEKGKEPDTFRWVKPRWREDLSQETADREQEADSLTTYINCWLGVVDYDGDIAAHGDWLQTHRNWSSKLYKHRYEGRQGKIWRMESIYRALPWPQGRWPTDERRLRRYYKVGKYDAIKPFDVKLRRPGKTQLIHMACTVIESREPIDERLYRSEVISALGLMSDHVGRGTHNWDYGVFPVFVYTFSGRSVRVLQFHYDTIEKRLHVRKTPFMHIVSENEMDKIKLVMRWIMNKPKGDLKLKGLPTNPNEEKDKTEVDNQPRTPRKSSIRCV